MKKSRLKRTQKDEKNIFQSAGEIIGTIGHEIVAGKDKVVDAARAVAERLSGEGKEVAKQARKVTKKAKKAITKKKAVNNKLKKAVKRAKGATKRVIKKVAKKGSTQPKKIPR